MDVVALGLAKSYAKTQDRRRDKRRDLAPSRLLTRQVAATSPTITISGTSAVGAGALQYDAVTSGVMTLIGGAGWAHPDNGWNAATYWRMDRAKDTNGLRTGIYRLAFNCDAAIVEVSGYWPPGSTYRIKVDDQYLTVTAVASGLAGVSRYLQLDFTAVGGAKPRRIVIDCGFLVAGLNTTATGTIWPAAPRGPRVVCFGDSYTGGSNGNGGPYTTWPFMVGDLFGWEDVSNNGIGSTGYLVSVGGQVNTTADQVAAAVAAGVSPDIVITTAGHNDVASNSAIGAAALAAHQAMRTAWPGALLVCGGPWWVGGAAGLSGAAAKESAILSAVGTAADILIPQASGAGVPWFTGTGKVGATTGSGNSDAYVYSDGIHPTQAGHDYAGYRFAQLFREALAQL